MKVWDKREFKDLDDDVELGTRNIKIALRRLRKFARTGAPDELDLDGTIKGTAHKGYLDIQMRPERHNAVKVLLFFDVGGSMDWHIKQVEELFSAARVRVQAHGVFLLPQLPLRGRVEGEPAPLHRHARRPGTCCTTIRTTTRWSSSATPRCRPYEIMRARRLGRALSTRRPGAVWLERITRTYPACGVAQSGGAEALGLFGIHHHHPPAVFASACIRSRSKASKAR